MQFLSNFSVGWSHVCAPDLLNIIYWILFNSLQKRIKCLIKIVSEYDQEIPQAKTTDKPWHPEEELHKNHETPGRQT